MKPARTLSQYRNFDIVLDGEPGRYTVSAVAPDGGRTAPEAFHLTSDETTDGLLATLASGLQVDAQALSALGTRLFTALFTRRITKAYAAAQAGLSSDQQLRLRLVVRPSELALFPWELLYDPDERTFLATLHSSPLTRYLETGRASKAITLEGPLKILYASANPVDTLALNLDESLANLQTGLAELEEKGHIELTVLQHTAPDKLQQALRRGHHILHFDGHGTFDLAKQQGYVMLEDEDGLAVPFPGELVAAFAESKGLRLVLLNACQTASGHPADPLAGVAQQLILAGSLPAVVAMQFPIRDYTAIAFLRHFYGALASGYVVEGAVAEGRKAIMSELKDAWRSHVDWATPVLYMQTAEGRLWHRPAPKPPPPSASVPIADFAPSEGYSHHLSQALFALSEMMRDPRVRNAVVTFRADFEAARYHARQLFECKYLHDKLHDLEFRCYTPIMMEAGRFPEHNGVLEAISYHQWFLQQIADDLREFVQRPGCDMAETSWIRLVVLAQDSLRGATSNLDANLLKEALRQLRRVLTTQPTRINARLIAAARSLRLSALVKAMQLVTERMASLELEPERMTQFKAGVEALVRLDRSMSALVEAHNQWQRLDLDLRRIEAVMDLDTEELEASWPELKVLSGTLLDNQTGQWATRFLGSIDSLDGAIAAGNPSMMRQRFRGFCREASDRFYRVDVALKKRCEDLSKVGEPLAAVLEMLQ